MQLLPVLLQEQQPVQGRQLAQVLKKKLYQPQRKQTSQLKKQTSQLKNLTCVNHEKNL